MIKPELLAPAGDLEKLKTAVIYGADAVYIGGHRYGLRTNASNFTKEQMLEGISFAHKHNRYVYVTVNIFAHNSDLDGFDKYVKELCELGADALIVSDPGLLDIIKETVPKMEVHISTQANVTNYRAVDFWRKQGAKRVVLARELSLAEIRHITSQIQPGIDIECFVHGAMCMSYSGRCYLSQYMNERDANRGNCSQPCRWGYSLMEEKRDGEYYPVYEDERGAYILNSKDMRMIEHVPELIDAGIISFKIEGRMKTAYYVASTVKAYRMAIDDYIVSKEKYYSGLECYKAETEKSSHRHYYKGFYFDGENKGSMLGQNSDSSSYIRSYDYKAVVVAYNDETNMALVRQKNKFEEGMKLEVLQQNGDGFVFTVNEMYDEKGVRINSAPHPNQLISIKMPQKVYEYNMLRHAQRP